MRQKTDVIYVGSRHVLYVLEVVYTFKADLVPYCGSRGMLLGPEQLTDR
jgi:hypothetical protein